MEISWKITLMLISGILMLDLVLLAATLIAKLRSRHKYRRQTAFRKRIGQILSTGILECDDLPRRQWIDFLKCWRDDSEQIRIPDEILKELKEKVLLLHLDRTIARLIRNSRRLKRSQGLLLSCFLEEDIYAWLLEQFIENERTPLLKLKGIELLCRLNRAESIDSILRSLGGASDSFCRKVISILSANHLQLDKWAEEHYDSLDPLVIRIIIGLCGRRNLSWFKEYLRNCLNSEVEDIRREAAEIYFHDYSYSLSFNGLLDSPFFDIRRMALEHYIRVAGLPESPSLDTLLQEEESRKQVIHSMGIKLRNEPELTPKIFKAYIHAGTEETRMGYAAILSLRIGYFLRQLKGEQAGEIRELIGDAVSLHRSSGIIDFLNSNREQDIENLLKETLSPYWKNDSHFLHQCRLYLRKELLERWRLGKAPQLKQHNRRNLGLGNKILLAILMLFSLSLVPALFFFSYHKVLPYMAPGEILVAFLFKFHFTFVYYTLAINAIYLLLLLISWSSMREQHISWNLADRSFLFTPGILPSISVLAPAFNEEKTIVQNVYSLLSLEYPQLELLVINDGSTDRTAQVLIEHFNLDRVDYDLSVPFPTAEVVGVYRSRSIPNLVLIDKENGGKADALNCGLNHAEGDYVCSIDADSLLEPDSLLKLMFRTLVNDRETLALGGNIIPVNGSRVEDGSLEEIHFPGNALARYQTMEYLRSFMGSRIGWSALQALLIISGAFGAFERKAIMDAGGYMTGSSVMHMDTVSEDMEIVVRLIRRYSEKKCSFRVEYSFNANCWTEVPEDLSSLVKQRDRWHRGLVEIMMIHKKMLGNPRYGAAGLLAFPYFFIFEMMGPFLELNGYIVLLLSLLAGLLNLQTFLFLFSLIILLGILVSSMALYLAEKEVVYFKGKDFFRCLWTSLVENFGYRQFVSILRSFSYFMYLFRNQGWQKLSRKGFNGSSVKREGDSM